MFTFLENLDGVKPVGTGKWVALCPCHDDRTPSLSVAVGNKVPVLARCFGCSASFAEILRAVEARAAGIGVRR